MRLELLVTGTGRSGTVYMAKLLSSAGIMCGHESLFTTEGIDGCLKRISGNTEIITSAVSGGEWFDPKNQSAESSYLAAPYADHDVLRQTKIIHIVRNPIKVVSSTLIDAEFFDDIKQKPYLNFVLQHTPEIMEEKSNLMRTVAYYVAWNQMIETKCANRQYKRIRVEDCPSALFEFLPWSNKSLHDDKKTNHWGLRKNDIDISDMPQSRLKKNFIDMCKKYGYQKECNLARCISLL
jgi:hypothetical protein